jgi:hypothetical protein
MALKVGQAAGLAFRRGDHRHRVVTGKDTRGIVTSALFTCQAPRRPPARMAKSIVCGSGSRTEIAEKVPMLGSRDGVDGARAGVWLNEEPCQNGCRLSNRRRGYGASGGGLASSSLDESDGGSAYPS